MQTNPAPADDLNDLESRLAQWRPATSGLDSDRMLFAAGQQSAPAGWGHIALPIVCVGLALLAAGLGAGFVHERAARIELLAQLQDQRPAVVPESSYLPEAGEIVSGEAPAASSYLVARTSLMQDENAWMGQAKIEPTMGPSLPNRPVLRANSSGEMLER